LLALGVAVFLLFLLLAIRWGIEVRHRMESQHAIGLVQERLATNLTQDALSIDARSYDWTARRKASGIYQVKHNLVLDRSWRLDRWENHCWEVRLNPVEVRRIGCQLIGWDRAPGSRNP
jgi:hypothetical protein